MASNSSFDVVSEINNQELDNAVNQAIKEISNRYDFKGTVANVELGKNEIKINAQDEYKLNTIIEILKGKMIKRGVSPKFLDCDSKIEAASGTTVKQTLKVKSGIEKDKAKEVIKDIKDSKIKVQAQIMDETVRVSGKDKDELQQVIALLKSKDYGIELQFTNYR